MLVSNSEYQVHFIQVALAMLPPLPLNLLIFLIPLASPAVLLTSASANKLRGVLPARQSLYVPTGKGTWKCLSGDKEIPWSKFNDDFCDCPDGSDEPGTCRLKRSNWGWLTYFQSIGTSACPNSTFYCVNRGHIGATIPSSRVDDGLCGEHSVPSS